MIATTQRLLEQSTVRVLCDTTANGKTPPGTQRMYALGEVSNFLGIMHARLSIETFVVRVVEGGLLRHRLVLSEGVQ